MSRLNVLTPLLVLILLFSSFHDDEERSSRGLNGFYLTKEDFLAGKITLPGSIEKVRFGSTAYKTYNLNITYKNKAGERIKAKAADLEEFYWGVEKGHYIVHFRDGKSYNVLIWGAITVYVRKLIIWDRHENGFVKTLLDDAGNEDWSFEKGDNWAENMEELKLMMADDKEIAAKLPKGKYWYKKFKYTQKDLLEDVILYNSRH